MKPSERISQIKEELIDEKAGAAGKRQSAVRERVAREMSGPKLDVECVIRYLDERHDQAQKGKTSK